MASRRIAWGAALLLSLVLLVLCTGWLALFLFLAALLTPLFSLALSLPALLGLTLSPQVLPQRLCCGETGALRLTARPGGRAFPFAFVRCRMKDENLFTREVTEYRWRARGCGALRWEAPLSVPHCGMRVFRVERATAYDLLGIFSRRVEVAETPACFVLPAPASPAPAPRMPGARERLGELIPRPGGGVGEDYEVRDYRPGDSLRQIHWKLTAKADETQVRELMEPVRPRLALSMELRGSPAALDAILGQLLWLSDWFFARELPFELWWGDTFDGTAEHALIPDRAALDSLLYLLLSAPAPADGPSRPPVPAASGASGAPAWHYAILPPGQDGGEALS